uniref:Putative secreted protein n=1 Tax=Ixodes ricinus TaxID=34613 RepID=A0A0K8RLZ0_IXORI
MNILWSPVAGGKNFGKFSICSLNQLSSFAGTLSQRCFNISVSSTLQNARKTNSGQRLEPVSGTSLGQDLLLQEFIPEIMARNCTGPHQLHASMQATMLRLNLRKVLRSRHGGWHDMWLSKGHFFLVLHS